MVFFFVIQIPYLYTLFCIWNAVFCILYTVFIWWCILYFIFILNEGSKWMEYAESASHLFCFVAANWLHIFWCNILSMAYHSSHFCVSTFSNFDFFCIFSFQTRYCEYYRERTSLWLNFWLSDPAAPLPCPPRGFPIAAQTLSRNTHIAHSNSTILSGGFPLQCKLTVMCESLY